MFCEQCGAKLENNKRFCQKCIDINAKEKLIFPIFLILFSLTQYFFIMIGMRSRIIGILIGIIILIIGIILYFNKKNIYKIAIILLIAGSTILINCILPINIRAYSVTLLIVYSNALFIFGLFQVIKLKYLLKYILKRKK